MVMRTTVAEPTSTLEHGDLVERVQRFLRLVEARDLEAAGHYLADDVTITFPGGRRFTSLTEQVASSAGRFRSVTKTFDGFDLIEGAAGCVEAGDSVVYVYGTLRGRALDGTAFAGIRYIDRFVIRDGLIIDQRVWNDLAESGALPDSSR